MLANRAASISLTESDRGTPERGRAGQERADSSPDKDEAFGDEF